MTPFERAKKNIDHFADGLAYCNLIQQTLLECEGMSEEETDTVWITILALLEMTGKLDDAN
tara:strand:- start:414 stop:596 length:183 start_codon:yes stop_codon:yes gene_type:complete